MRPSPLHTPLDTQRRHSLLLLAVCGNLFSSAAAAAADAPAANPRAPAATTPIAEAVGRRLIDPSIPLQEIRDYLSPLVPPMPKITSVDNWEQYAERARSEVFERSVFRGEAKRWRALATRVEWQNTIADGPG